MTDFARDGFALLHNVFDAGSLDEVTARVDELHAAPPPGPTCERPGNTLIPLRWDDPIVTTVFDSPLPAALARVADADDLRWVSGYVTSKNPGSEPLWWHQDWWCWDHPASFRPEPVQIAVLVYLSETGPETGALRVLPGSHRNGDPLHTALPQAPDGTVPELPPDHVTLRDHPGQVVPAVRPGDAVVLDYRLLHGTFPHHGVERRDGIIVNFVPRWRDVPADIRAHLVRHPALPGDDEVVPPAVKDRLPTYEGVKADLPLRRTPPAEFAVG